jgi:hypothetical protein
MFCVSGHSTAVLRVTKSGGPAPIPAWSHFNNLFSAKSGSDFAYENYFTRRPDRRTCADFGVVAF